MEKAVIRRTNHKPGDAIISGGKSYFIAKDGSYIPYDRARHERKVLGRAA